MAVAVLVTRICKSGIRFYSCCIQINDAYILAAARTPIGAFQGKLSSLTAVDLASKALIGAIDKSDVCRDEIQELILGCAIQTGLGQGPAHQVARYAELNHSTVTWTLNKLCASGMKAVMIGCQLLYNHAQEVVAAGGTESITNIPYMFKRKKLRLGNICMSDLIFHDGLLDMINQTEVTHFAEETVKANKYTREEQDQYAVTSCARALQAVMDGAFRSEIVPVTIKNKEGVEEAVCEDEEIRRCDEEKIKAASPELGKEGTITGKNSSGLADGASAVILASGNYVLKKDLKPIARVVSFADATLPANKFCISPSVVIPKALLKANLTPEKISLWEINETYAVTALVNSKILKLPPEKVNIHGGAISLGHPFGMTGNRLIVHLVHSLKPGELGCACISHASGGGSAIVVEKL